MDYKRMMTMGILRKCKKLYKGLVCLNNIDYQVIYVRSILNKYFLSDNYLSHSYGVSVRILSMDSDVDVRDWVYVMNNSYEDETYDNEKAKNFFKNHIFLTNLRTYLFYNKGGVFASITTGAYQNNPSVAGLCRIGVINSEKRKSYGEMIVLYALSKLQTSGFKVCEDLISVKRMPSFILHQKCGFYVVENRTNVIFNYTPKCIWKKIILHQRTRDIIKEYQSYVQRNFIK